MTRSKSIGFIMGRYVVGPLILGLIILGLLASIVTLGVVIAEGLRALS